MLALAVGAAGLARSPLLQPAPELRPQEERPPVAPMAVEVPAGTLSRPEPCVGAGCSG
jgi:hypothetical protein